MHSIAGKDIVCNPPYEKITMFKMLLEAAYDIDNTTRAYFIVPLKGANNAEDVRNVWLKEIVQEGRWRMLKWYGEQTPLFSKPATKKTQINMRNIQQIGVFELNKSPNKGQGLDFERFHAVCRMEFGEMYQNLKLAEKTSQAPQGECPKCQDSFG